MNNIINTRVLGVLRVPGIPEHYQEAAREANLAFDQKMKELRSSMSNAMKIPEKYLDGTERGPTAQDYARN